MRTNSEGTLKLVKVADDHDASFLYASTSEVYGDPEEHPQTEDYNGNVNPVGPRACYDEAKRYGEALITSYARENDVDWNIIRIFNTYGPRLREDDGRVISNFITQALNDEPLTVYGDGSQTRSFCYVDDLTRGIKAVMNHEDNDVFNLGNPDETTILELAEIVQDVVDTESEIVHRDLPDDDPSKRKPEIIRVEKEAQWTPEVDLEQGLRITKDQFK
jgi:nucleoside-diphosphate-sugar epimerase